MMVSSKIRCAGPMGRVSRCEAIPGEAKNSYIRGEIIDCLQLCAMYVHLRLQLRHHTIHGRHIDRHIHCHENPGQHFMIENRRE